jgi:DNA polymerase-3 subunit alpha
MVDLHRHDEYSTFDGYGKARELVAIAKELGYSSLGLSNHGNTNGLVQHYSACKEAEIKPILGVEGYFQPVYNKEKPTYHLCLFAKNLIGYENLNTLMFEGEKQKYYVPIITFKELEKYHDGVICSSACIAGFISSCVKNKKIEMARKALKKFADIFDDDFYIEIQPYTIGEDNLQERVNVCLMKLADELNIKCILTSDSHYGSLDDWDTYLKMHAIGKHNYDIKATYGERYMPSEKELVNRFIKMHKKDFKNIHSRADIYMNNLQEIEDKVEPDIIGQLELAMPKMNDNETEEQVHNEFVQAVKDGLKKRGKLKKNYIDRCKFEIDVISYHKFEGYFMMVADYTNWAKSHGIVVGPGRGSACNSLVCYSLGITDVDSLRFDLNFNRFLRKDKKKMPDIDLDFETARRDEVINYLITRYQGHATKICSYGFYKKDNLLNDLFKVCGLDLTDKTADESELKIRKEAQEEIKNFVKKTLKADNEDALVSLEDLLEDDRLTKQYDEYNRRYDNIMHHFYKMFKKVRFIGTHASGVAISGDNILKYTAIKVKDGEYYSAYDLFDLEQIKVIKFDILGLKTMESLGELRKLTGHTCFDDNLVDDEKIIQAFNKGECDGVFQFNQNAVRQILQDIDADCFSDVIAATAMNRPGPLSLGMPAMYAEFKGNTDELKDKVYFEYVKETYGCILYQEQVQAIAVNIGGLTWADADIIIKMGNNKGSRQSERRFLVYYEQFVESFKQQAKAHHLTEEEAKELFEKLTNYAFNKGHATGYALVSIEEMFYKVYYPTEYWYTKIKYAKDETEIGNFSSKAVKDDVAVFLPHVNYSTAKTRLRKDDGELVIQQGLATIKDVGEKAADVIYEERRKNGIFRSYDEFVDRCKCRVVTSKVISVLKTQGAIEFDKETYAKRVIKYNTALLMRAK